MELRVIRSPHGFVQLAGKSAMDSPLKARRRAGTARLLCALPPRRTRRLRKDSHPPTDPARQGERVFVPTPLAAKLRPETPSSKALHVYLDGKIGAWDYFEYNNRSGYHTWITSMAAAISSYYDGMVAPGTPPPSINTYPDQFFDQNDY